MSQTEEASQVTVRDLLKLRDFRLLWLGQIVSNFGDALTQLTLVLLINRVTDGSTTAIAYLLIALALPQATVGLVAGVFVDRFDRKRTMIVSDILRGVLVFGFIYVVFTEGSGLWLIYVIAFLHSTVGAFFLPARSALIPNIVPQEGLLAANSLSQMSVVLLRVLGSAVAGVLVGVFDTFWVAFVLDAATFFGSMLFISQIRVPRRETAVTPSSQPISVRVILGELREGWSIIARSRILIGTLLGIAITMLGIGAINVLLAPLLVNEMGVKETWFGAIEFAQTSAMILSGTLVAILAAKFKPTNIITAGLFALGVFIAPLALIQTVWHLIPILFVVGLVITPLNASVATIVQTAVADEVRGRISAALGAIIQTASLISMFAAGAVAAAIGVRNVFVLGGAIVVIAAATTVWTFRGYTLPKLEILETAVPTPEHILTDV